MTNSYYSRIDHRPSVDQLLTDTSVNYRPTIGEVSAKSRWTKSYTGRDTSGTTIDLVSTECRPIIDRLSTAISTDCRPSVDRVSTDCRPSIDRLSTEYRPTVDRLSTDCRPTIDRVSTAISTAMSTDISVDIIHSKQDPNNLHLTCDFSRFSHSLRRSSIKLRNDDQLLSDAMSLREVMVHVFCVLWDLYRFQLRREEIFNFSRECKAKNPEIPTRIWCHMYFLF